MEAMAVTQIHPLALVHPEAVIGQDVEIGPFCVVERAVTIGDGCKLAGHVFVKTGTTLGKHNHIAEGAVIGGRPQHLGAGSEVGRVIIGDHNHIRENVTIHLGLTPKDTTSVGNHCLIMVNVHIAHDCHIGDNVIMANNAMLAGHVHIGNRAYISGAVGIHQFCRVGAFAMVGGQAHITQDIPPYVTVDGQSSLIVGLNKVGLKRAGFSDTDMKQLKEAYRVIYRSGARWNEVLTALKASFTTGPAAAFGEFFSEGKRGFVQERRTPPNATIKIAGAEEAAKSEEVRKVG
jgi:UDP-N-acetylglucosamine acyltransferase